MRTYVRMAHSSYLRQMARLLRVEQRLSVDQLARRLALPRSTVYYWVRDLPLNASASEGAVEGGADGLAPATAAVAVGSAPGDRSAVRAGGALARRRHSRPSSETAYEDGLRSFADLDTQPTFRDFVCLYVMRGCTREQTKVSLTDSDPAVIRLVNRWLLRLSDKSPLLSVQYGPDQSLAELRRFWGAIVGAEARTIRAEGLDAVGAERQRRESCRGVLTLTVDDALLRARLQAWISKTRDSWQ
jgi:hypothetical protein